jgi:hypothetical protein
MSHLDQQPLPARIVFDGVELILTAGRLEINSPDDLTGIPGNDGSLYWSLTGQLHEADTPSPFIMARYRYRIVSRTRLEFPVEPDGPGEFTLDLANESANLYFKASEGEPQSASGLFGKKRTWQFRAAPNEEPPQQFRVYATPVPLT